MKQLDIGIGSLGLGGFPSLTKFITILILTRCTIIITILILTTCTIIIGVIVYYKIRLTNLLAYMLFILNHTRPPTSKHIEIETQAQSLNEHTHMVILVVLFFVNHYVLFSQYQKLGFYQPLLLPTHPSEGFLCISFHPFH